MINTSKSLIQNLVWRGLFHISALILNICIAKHFHASVSGSIYYISALYAFLLLITSFSLESGIIHFAAKKEVAKSRLFGFSLLWSLIVGIAVLICANFIFTSAYKGIPSSLILISSVTFIGGNLLMTYCSGLFYAENNFYVPNLINFVSTSCLIIVLPFHGRSIIPFVNDGNYFYVYFSSFLVQGICIAIWAKIKYIRSNSLQLPSGVEFRLLVRYSALAFLGNILYFLLCRIDYFFVSEYCSAAQLGNYIQVTKLGQLLLVVPLIMAMIVFSHASNPSTIRGLEKLQILCRLMTVFFISISLALILSGKWLFPWLFGTGFSDMYQVMLNYLPGFFSLSIVTLLAAYIAGKAMQRYNIFASALSFIVVVIGDRLLIPGYGINAAGAVSSVAYFVCMLYLLRIFSVKMEISWRNFFLPKRSDFKLVIALINKNLSNR